MKQIIFLAIFLVISGTVYAEDNNRLGDVFDRVGKHNLSFYSYRPSYFGITTSASDNSREGQAKFQFSVKYEIIDNSGLFFGYTQKSFWNIHEESAPFAESNFAPEIFNLFEMADLEDNKHPLKTIQVGWARHESTGEDGPGSHGWNITYIEPTIILGNFTITPIIWIPFAFMDETKMAPDNPDIFNYYGYGELNLAYGIEKNNQLSLMLRKGSATDHITYLAQYDIGLNNILEALGCSKSEVWNPNLFIQYWSGYGESLKFYNESTNRCVIGFSIIK